VPLELPAVEYDPLPLDEAEPDDDSVPVPLSAETQLPSTIVNVSVYEALKAD